MTVEPVPTPSAPPVAGPYSPAVRAGDFVVLAGQVGIGGDGKLVAGGIEPETEQVLANIRAVLDDCGGSWADVARATIFLTDLGNFATVNALYEGAIGAHRPARPPSASRACPPAREVEIECWAYLPEETT